MQHICQVAHVNITEPTSMAACSNLEKDFYNFVLRVQKKNAKKNQGPNIPVPQARDRGHTPHAGGDFDMYYKVSGWWWGGGMHEHKWVFLVPGVEGMSTSLERLAIALRVDRAPCCCCMGKPRDLANPRPEVEQMPGV